VHVGLRNCNYFCLTIVCLKFRAKKNHKKAANYLNEHGRDLLDQYQNKAIDKVVEMLARGYTESDAVNAITTGAIRQKFNAKQAGMSGMSGMSAGGMMKKQTRHFSGGIEVEHHGKRPCDDNCILNGKNQGGLYNQALADIKSKLNK
jgi:hypothetical protein